MTIVADESVPDHGEQDAGPDGVATSVVDDLIQRARTLLAELQIFQNRVRTLRREGLVEVAHFRSTIQSELGMLERLSEKPDDDATRHVARSSNMPFLETIWSTAKASRDIISLQKRIYTSPGVKSAPQGMRHIDPKGTNSRGKGVKGSAVVVDTITDAGKSWKRGWNSGGSDDEDDAANGQRPQDDDDDDVPLLKTAKELTSAAMCFRVRTQTPQVYLILPRVQYGALAEIDAVIDACRATGATLILGEQMQPPPHLDDALRIMAPDPIESFSPTLNIDCTVLLALVSEFSHAKVSKQPWFHTALQRQVEIEDNENLLPSLLYPAMGSHDLVCTAEAVKRMREIVATIGTPSEKARTAVMLGDDASKSREDLLDEMQEWSAYPVPRDWQLPIRAIDQDDGGCLATLPPQALQVAKAMTSINQSVFLYGWATRCTTITSNRTVVKQIESELETFANLDDEAVWPPIWLCPTARSLVGKEKRSAKKAGAGEGEKEPHTAWPLPDPLRREQQRRNGLDVLARRKGLDEIDDWRPQGYPYEEVLAAKRETSYSST
ncbi:hypothetical protein LTR53_002824 [Teratosphaeriaceae sp. CCFEE 6253]|nr:hypothetical protein LTR53_002824 [Teratosphaeriaceae sp. CCFEE 6253]